MFRKHTASYLLTVSCITVTEVSFGIGSKVSMCSSICCSVIVLILLFVFHVADQLFVKEVLEVSR